MSAQKEAKGLKLKHFNTMKSTNKKQESPFNRRVKRQLSVAAVMAVQAMFGDAQHITINRKSNPLPPAVWDLTVALVNLQDDLWGRSSDDQKLAKEFFTERDGAFTRSQRALEKIWGSTFCVIHRDDIGPLAFEVRLSRRDFINLLTR